MASGGVTPRQEAFIQALIRGLTQRQAYYEAYPNSRKWKPESVDSKASTLLRKDKVWKRYSELRDAAAKANDLNRDTILQQLKAIGFSEIDPDKIRPADKIKALEVITRIMGFEDSDKGQDAENVSPYEEALKELFHGVDKTAA